MITLQKLKQNSKYTVDGIFLEVGKSYWFKYTHCESRWKKLKITRHTEDFAWGEGDRYSGIISPGSYKVSEFDPTLQASSDQEILLFAEWIDIFAIRSNKSEWTYKGDNYKSRFTTSELLQKFRNKEFI